MSVDDLLWDAGHSRMCLRLTAWWRLAERFYWWRLALHAEREAAQLALVNARRSA